MNILVEIKGKYFTYERANGDECCTLCDASGRYCDRYEMEVLCIAMNGLNQDTHDHYFEEVTMDGK